MYEIQTYLVSWDHLTKRPTQKFQSFIMTRNEVHEIQQTTTKM